MRSGKGNKMQYRLVEVEQNLTLNESKMIKLVFSRTNSYNRASTITMVSYMQTQLAAATNSLVTYVRSNMASPQLRALIGSKLAYSNQVMVISLDSVTVTPVKIEPINPNPQGRGLPLLLGGAA